jgi:ribonucleoside-diphosphate reductase alpha chain
MKRNIGYEVTPELHRWLNVYEQESNASAYIFAKQLGVTIPKAKRAIAPNGTLGILAETTSGIEPLFCKSYKRRYYKDGTWKYQYVVDGSVQRLIDSGIKLEQIKDSFDISFKERVKFQADVQQYVDMAISSTCNLPAWGSETNNESTLDEYSKILYKYAKRLRGFTVYPDGCRSGQPLERCDLKEAMENVGKVFESKQDLCVGGVCGI